jgi:hypothetical protein
MDPRIRIRIHTKISGEVKPLYEAESPDELALIDAAYAYNCRLLKRSPDRLTVSLPGDGQVSVAGTAEISAADQKQLTFLSYCFPAGRWPGWYCRRRRNFGRWQKINRKK